MARALDNLKSAINKVEAKAAALQEELEKINLCHIGHNLMQRAGKAAVDAGQTEGPGLFEQFEATQETQKVIHDARALAYMWSLASSPTGLQRGIDMLNLKTFTGRLAAIRLVKHYDEVLAYEFQQMEEPAQYRM